MKLLIITQVLDKEHPILGFFHRWVQEFAVHCEQVHVICLQEGVHALPANVTVHSLGKESGENRFKYIFRFYTYIWQLRKEYDSVFVHMNQIYVLLGAPFWHVFRKKISLWYMHGSIPASLRIAEKFVDKIYTGSTESFRLKSRKVVVTGHGIDTARFIPQDIPKIIDLVTVGRITPSKNLHQLIAAFGDIHKTTGATLTIVGRAVTNVEKMYEKDLQQQISEGQLTDKVFFRGAVSQVDLPTILNQSKIFVSTAKNGSLDKAVLEAMSCGIQVVSMAAGTTSLPLGSAQVNTISEFVTETKKMLESGVSVRADYIDFVKKTHSLQSLIPKILN